jgi:aspartokinase/homoserine dehydrogenase 1
MKVLKFGGSSVGNYERIKSVGKIIKDKLNDGEQVAVVFSAFQGITDLLIEIGVKASKGDVNYNESYKLLAAKTNEIVNGLLKKSSKAILKNINNSLIEISDLLRGIFLIKEISNKTMDNLLSYGERISN